MDNNIRNTKRTSLHHRPTEERTRTEGGVNNGRKHILIFHGIGCISHLCRIELQKHKAVDEG